MRNTAANAGDVKVMSCDCGAPAGADDDDHLEIACYMAQRDAARDAVTRVLALCNELDADHQAICRQPTSPLAAAIRAAIAGPQGGS